MLAAFEGSKVAHGTTKVGRTGRTGKAEADSRIVREPLTEAKIEAHLRGGMGVGGIPINVDNQCKWGALDIDVYDLDHKALQQKIQKLKLPLVHCRTKSGGAHLYLFLDQFYDAKDVREFLTEFAIALGHSGCEVFPKQDTILSDRGDVGNFINMPYQNADMTMRYAFNEQGEAMDLGEFLDKIEASRVSLSNWRASSYRRSGSTLPTARPALSTCLLTARFRTSGTRSCSTSVSTVGRNPRTTGSRRWRT